MNTKYYITVLLLIFLSSNIYSQAKKQEITVKHKNGSPSIIKLKETKISFNKTATELFLKNSLN